MFLVKFVRGKVYMELENMYVYAYTYTYVINVSFISLTAARLGQIEALFSDRTGWLTVRHPTAESGRGMVYCRGGNVSRRRIRRG